MAGFLKSSGEIILIEGLSVEIPLPSLIFIQEAFHHTLPDLHWRPKTFHWRPQTFHQRPLFICVTHDHLIGNPDRVSNETLGGKMQI